ncbi:hypothetical protein B0J15DRAFT_565160 [Fusarium solani]|uniref:Rhodopsin domain-containing protein n=1 Tax=Fusarium solani TaxID=169388 RepID=A0A9P9K8G2_FUSSL|nr:uncharacterized protein B0J15DRAFT_565160 [Fusarium solani]KAH7243824.1 hypothetical protein B0J15DRAFT_565160 [Fusarium solani]
MTATPDPSDFPPEFLEYDEGATLVGVCAAMIPVATVIVGVRFWARWRKQMHIGIDDWLILISLCLFIGEFTYGTVLCTIKAAILLMYYRVFPTRFMKFGGYVLGAITFAWWVAVVFVSIFQCVPVHKTWHPFMEGGHCLDKNQFFLGNSIPNIITDALILCLPVYEVSKLQVRRSQKFAIIGIFLLGGIIVMISCIRLKVVIDLVNAGPELIGPCWIWTTVEPTIGLLCASLPTMRPVLHLLFGRFIGESSKEQENTSGLVTIGGTGLKSTNKNKVQTKDGPFKRLYDNDSAEEPVLWPESYIDEQSTVVERTVYAKDVGPEAIPLDSIAVHKGMTWTESRRAGY